VPPRDSSVQTAFRLPRDMLRRIDRVAKALEKDVERGSIRVTRAHATRLIILKGLAAYEKLSSESSR